MKTKAKFEYITTAIFIIFPVLMAACATVDRSGLQPKKAQIRNPGSITIPAEFPNVWYRGEEKGNPFVAYSASGKLTISELGLKFGAGKDALKVNINDIHSITWGKLSGDFYNNWAILKYGNPEKIAGFKDGTNLGHGQDTDLIFSTLKYSVEVLGGRKPSIEPPFASGWIDIGAGGLMAPSSQELNINLLLQNKFGNSIWVKVEFLNPNLSLLCEVTKLIPSKKNDFFACPLKSVITDQFYPVYISVFLDKDQSKLVEKTGTRMRFSQQDQKSFKELQKKL